MAQKLDFSLPEKKARGSTAGLLTALLLIVLAVLAAANLFVALSRKPAGPGSVTPEFSAGQTKALAARLAQRDLYAQAAATWQDYLASAELTAQERARIHFQIGTLYEQAGRYADAIDQYYRSEAVAQLDELGPQLNAHVKECFERLGKFAALRYELMDRTSIHPAEAAGGKIVAEIGAEKITESRLDALIEQSVESQLAPMQAFLTPEQLSEQKKRTLEQLRAPQTRLEFLRGWLAEEILYRQALQEQLSEQPEVKRLIHDLTRGALSQQLMNEQLASRINITETDLQTYYAANPGKYVEPARASIRHIRVSDQEQARTLLERLRQGDDFAKLAEASSEDAESRTRGGLMESPVVRGESIPGIGDANEISAAIFAAKPPAVLDTPFQTDKGWEIIKVEELQPQRQKSFDGVRQQVMMQLLREKRQDVQQDYIREMMDKHGAIIHASALMPAPQEQSDNAPQKQ